MLHRLRTRARSERGMTLIELSIVLLIIGLTMGVVIPTVATISRASLKSAAAKLRASIRFGYELAARKGVPFRMVFDLDSRTYWIESSADSFVLSRDKEEVRAGAVHPEEEEKKRSRRFVNRGFVESGEMWKPKGPPAFAQFPGPYTAKVSLPDGVRFRSVWIGHQKGAVSSGLTSLYFFPTGMTERANLVLREEDGSVYTLVVEGLTGRVQVFPKVVEPPEDER